MPVPIPMGLIELIEAIGKPASTLIIHYLGSLDIGLITTIYCPFIIAMILYQMDAGHHRLITFLSVTVPFALIPGQEIFKSIIGLHSTLNTGLAPILAIFIACMAVFKGKLSLRPPVLMTMISAVVWLISHLMFYLMESYMLQPGLSQIHSTQYAWRETLESSTLTALCADATITCLSGASIDTLYYQAGMQGIYTYPLRLTSSLVSSVWIVGLLLVIFFHRRKNHV